MIAGGTRTVEQASAEIASLGKERKKAQKVRTKAQLANQKAETGQQYHASIKDLTRQFDEMYKQVSGLWRNHVSSHDDYMRRQFHNFETAVIEALAENKNKQQELLRFFHAISLRIAYAGLSAFVPGVRLAVDTNLAPKVYLQQRPGEQDPSNEPKRVAKSAQDRLDALGAKLADAKEDPRAEGANSLEEAVAQVKKTRAEIKAANERIEDLNKQLRLAEKEKRKLLSATKTP